MTDEKLKTLINELIVQQKKLLEVLGTDVKKRNKNKDFWDKFSSLSTFLSSVLIAGIGLYFTNTYNERQSQRDLDWKKEQNRIAEIQTVEKFIPHLTGSEESKKVAILTISSLGNTELATQIAQLYGTQGTVSALTSIATKGSVEDRRIANKALANIFAKYQSAVVQLSSKGCKASGILVSKNGFILTADYVCQEKGKLEVTTGDRKTYQATLQKVDKTLGLAVFKIDESSSSFPFLTFAERPAALQEEVIAIGTTPKELIVPTAGVVSKIDTRFVTVVFDSSEMGGSGGGPVMNIDGQVIGIIYQGRVRTDSRSEQECIRSDTAASFLKSLEIKL